MDEISRFDGEMRQRIERLGADEDMVRLSHRWLRETIRRDYSYNFSWLGRPIIQYPQDIQAMQEIIWDVQPDLIIETGIAHGGSLVFYASMLELLGGDGHVVGIDIDVRAHNRDAIEAHPMFRRITLIEGASTDDDIVQTVHDLARGKKRVLVALDSNHTHAHVLRELDLYSPLVSKGSYVVVFDTIIEIMPEGFFADRPWDKGNNPKTAVHEFLRTNERFAIDVDIQNRLLITASLDGYLRCVKD